MGFAAAVSVPDGVAFASDSRIQAAVQDGPPVVMSDSQQKIVQIAPRVAAVVPEPLFSTSSGHLVNLRSLLQDVSADLPPRCTLEQALDELPGRLASRMDLGHEDKSQAQLRLVGFSDTDRTVKVAILEGLDAEPSYRHTTANPGLDWFGYVDIADRIVNGVSVIGQDGRPEPSYGYNIPTPLMSLQDAIDLAETLVQTTATFAKFVRLVNPPGGAEPQPWSIPAGGAVQSAVVTRDGFAWVKRPPGPVMPPGGSDLE